MSRRLDDNSVIPARANRILNIILVGIVLVILRIWHLAVVQHDEKLEESRKPQRRVVMEPAKRGTIRDRFNVPLAINKLQYNATILYSQIKQIPTSVWHTNEEGKRVKRYMRREYMTALSQLLSRELDMDLQKVEDLIYAKAALYNQLPFTLKDNISEKEYYRLKILEKDWPGIGVQRLPVRSYPMGKVASDIIGYMGAINKQEYEKIIHEIASLDAYFQSVDAGEEVPLPSGIIAVDQGRRRLKDLQELAYTMNDSIGKTGIEGRFEHELRGFRGKRSHYSDAKGNFLRDLPGTREAIPGKRLFLTISAELQEYAEQLLIANENIRQPYLSRLGPVKRTILADKSPWIKGGAIVAIDPNNGEILAMASHPRFDPNDFILSGTPEENKQKRSHILQWLEHEAYLGEIWNRQRPLEKEVFQKVRGIYLEECPLTWPQYLDMILSKKHTIRNTLLKDATIEDAINIQKSVADLLSLIPFRDAYQLFSILYLSDGHREYGEKTSLSEKELLGQQLANHAEIVGEKKLKLDGYMKGILNSYDKVLVVDLMRLAVSADLFSKELLQAVGSQSLADYKELSGALVAIDDTVKNLVRSMHHENDFKQWRQANEKAYLKEKREEEKRERRYARPYLDYLDTLENEMFQHLWQQNRYLFLQTFLTGYIPENATPPLYFASLQDWHQEIHRGTHQQEKWIPAYTTLRQALYHPEDGITPLPPQLAIEYLQTLRSFHQLNRPLLGKYKHLRKGMDGVQLEKHLAAAFYPKGGYGYGRSQAYRQATTQGSIFKIVTAYEALVQRYRQLKESVKTYDLLNPLTIDDRVIRQGKELCVGFHLDGTPIPRYYKGGRMPRSLSTRIGNIDIMKAIERSSNPYFALLAGDFFNSPYDLADTARQFSFGSKTGIELPGEIAGNIPNDLDTNRTGLYSFSIGQHTLVVTPLQTSLMLSSLVNGGQVLTPKIVKMSIGKEPKRGRELIAGNCHFPYQAALELVGIDFPLFSATDAGQQKSLVKQTPVEVKRTLFLPTEIQRILVESMRLVVERTQSESLFSLNKLYNKAPEAIKDYIDLKKQLIGKTSTAESVENIDLEQDAGTNIYTHVWFGGIAFDRDMLDHDSDSQKFLFRDSTGKPELVVVVYLRYGGYGKEAAPVAAQVAKRWKEIKSKQNL